MSLIRFDEGAAMQVDFRPRYRVNPNAFDESEIQRVETLNSPNQFWGARSLSDLTPPLTDLNR